jgi:hypothetical protein
MIPLLTSTDSAAGNELVESHFLLNFHHSCLVVSPVNSLVVSLGGPKKEDMGTNIVQPEWALFGSKKKYFVPIDHTHWSHIFTIFLKKFPHFCPLKG